MHRRYLTSISFPLAVLVACVSADPDRTSVSITDSRIKSLQSRDYSYAYPKTGLLVTLTVPDDARSGILDSLLDSVFVDNADAGYRHLLSHFVVAYLAVENRGSQPAAFVVHSLKWRDGGSEAAALRPAEVPQMLERLNTKGIVKNIYNTSVIVGATAVIVFIAVGCAKEGKCEGLRMAPRVGELSTSGETDPDRVYSNMMHKVGYKFDNLLEPEFTLKPGETRQGVVMFPRPSGLKSQFTRIFYEPGAPKIVAPP